MLLKKPILAVVRLNDSVTFNVLTTFVFNPDAPVEVKVIFHHDNDDDIEWVFARDLLNHGMNAPTGLGDVTIWYDGSHVNVQLIGEHILTLIKRTAICRFSYASVMEFLMTSYALVPRNDEELRMDIDNVINKILQQSRNGE